MLLIDVKITDDGHTGVLRYWCKGVSAFCISFRREVDLLLFWTVFGFRFDFIYSFGSVLF